MNRYFVNQFSAAKINTGDVRITSQPTWLFLVRHEKTLLSLNSIRYGFECLEMKDR